MVYPVGTGNCYRLTTGVARMDDGHIGYCGIWASEWLRAGNGLRLIARLPLAAMVPVPGSGRYLAFVPREWSQDEREAQLKVYMWEFWLATFGLEQTREHLREHLAQRGAEEHGAA